MKKNRLKIVNSLGFQKPTLNSFIKMQKKLYKNGTTDHREHNDNPDYWHILLGDINTNFDGKRALDFGCGKGRNISNLLSLAKFENVDGSDLSSENIKYCRNNFSSNTHTFFLTNGSDTGETKSDYYDFVMSTITLQHIPIYQIRRTILVDILRVLKPGGLFSFQMGFGSDLEDILGRPRSKYFEDAIGAKSTNGNHDVRILDSDELVSDLVQIGFSNVETQIKSSFSDIGHPSWIYVKCSK
jgi:SAM-dependent methyltransferase